MINTRYIRISLLILAIFFAVFSFWGFFKIGILSDTFGDAYTAVNSNVADKIINNLQFIDVNRYRPVLFLSLQGIVNLNSLLGIPYDSFILYKVINILLYFSYLVYRIPLYSIFILYIE